MDSHWSLVIGHWSLVIGHWSLVIGDIDFRIKSGASLAPLQHKKDKGRSLLLAK
ncbi:hypothetical protein [Coleofasciculus sp. E1-EBD-02]|uniref:hypothetical protein n=1 Tax=Coleofasciculus sp. E1-EBD-02 TaxID=3068481 RepID=UPI0033021223